MKTLPIFIDIGEKWNTLFALSFRDKGDTAPEQVVSGEIFLSMLEPVNTFNLVYSANTYTINPGDAVLISFGTDSGRPNEFLANNLIEGYIETVEASEYPDSIQYSLSGSSSSVDLECTLPAQVYRSKTTKQLIKSILSSGIYDLKYVRLPEDDYVWPVLKINRGDTYLSVLQTICDKRGLFFYTDIDNQLVFQNASPTNSVAYQDTILQRGVNLVNIRRILSHKDRYSDYFFTGQSIRTDADSAGDVSAVRSKIKDSTIKRYRPYFVTTQAKNKKEADLKAQWERDRRIADSDTLTCTVAGFTTGDSNYPVWIPNKKVLVDANPIIGLTKKKEYLITSVRYSFSAESAQMTELTLVDPEALIKFSKEADL